MAAAEASPAAPNAPAVTYLGIDHIDLRVASLAAVEPFYDLLLPALGLTRKTHSVVDADGEWHDAPEGTPYNVSEYHEEASPGLPARFLGIIEDPAMTPAKTRVAFRVASEAALAFWQGRLTEIGAARVEGETTGPYPALFFEDPCGTRLELCARRAR